MTKKKFTTMLITGLLASTAAAGGPAAAASEKQPLPLRTSVSQYGITWTFDPASRPAIAQIVTDLAIQPLCECIRPDRHSASRVARSPLPPSRRPTRSVEAAETAGSEITNVVRQNHVTVIQ